MEEYAMPAYWISESGRKHSSPSIERTTGPERTVTDQPAEEGWEPPPFLGFKADDD